MSDGAGERWRRIEAVFEAAVELPAESRSAFVEAETVGDDVMRGEVESLLEAHADASRFLVEPAFETEAAHSGPSARRTIGPYRTLRVLGTGGMGIVYEAEQESPRRRVALKVIRGGRFVEDRRIQLFMRESNTLARLTHPSIAGIFDAGITPEGEHYFVMELVEGAPLQDFVRANALDVRQRLSLFLQLARAIDYAHRRGVIHRDLKPSNVLVVSDQDGCEPRVKVLDFGLARIVDADVSSVVEPTATGQVMGTLAYMSPEQAEGKTREVGVTSDVYSLGVVLFELLAGDLPYQVRDAAPLDAARRIRDDAPRWPASAEASVDGDLRTVVQKALEKEISRRYAEVRELVDDVERYLAGQPVQARPPSTAYQLGRMVARNKLSTAFVATVILGLLAFGIYATSQAARFREQHQLAVAAGRRENAAKLEETRARLQAEEQKRMAESEAERANLQAHKSDAVRDFVQDIFASLHPHNAIDRDMTVREMLDRAKHRLDHGLTDDAEVRAVLHSIIGKAYENVGEYDEARAQIARALDLRREYFGSSHPDVADSLHELGSILHSTGRPDLAEPLYRDALEMSREFFSDDSEPVATTLGDLAALLGDRGDYDAALEILDYLWPLVSETYPEGHEYVTHVRGLLGSTLLDLGRTDAAQPLLEQTLRERIELHGDLNLTVASTRNALGVLHRERGDLSEAEEVFREALRTRRAILGHHKDVANSLNNLAVVLQEQHRCLEAVELAREALDIHYAIFGELHGEVARGLMNLGHMLSCAGELEEAGHFLREGLATMRLVWGSEHEGSATAQYNLGAWQFQTGDLVAAEENLAEAVATIERVFPAGHRRIGISRRLLEQVREASARRR